MKAIVIVRGQLIRRTRIRSYALAPGLIGTAVFGFTTAILGEPTTGLFALWIGSVIVTWLAGTYIDQNVRVFCPFCKLPLHLVEKSETLLGVHHCNACGSSLDQAIVNKGAGSHDKPAKPAKPIEPTFETTIKDLIRKQHSRLANSLALLAIVMIVSFIAMLMLNRISIGWLAVLLLIFIAVGIYFSPRCPVCKDLPRVLTRRDIDKLNCCCSCKTDFNKPYAKTG